MSYQNHAVFLLYGIHCHTNEALQKFIIESDIIILGQKSWLAVLLWLLQRKDLKR